MAERRCVITVGNFDGVHLGHQRLLAEAGRVAGGLGATVTVAAFRRHPLTELRPESAPRPLTDEFQRESALRSYGAAEVVWLDPTKPLLGLTAEQFVERVVREHTPAAWVEGPDFRFGKGRAGDMALLARLGSRLGFNVLTVEAARVRLADQSEVMVSSSLVRFLLSHGRVEDAWRCLGRPPSVRGKVMRGEGRGRTIGFPTANLDVGDRLLPADGVYAGLVELEGAEHPAAVSVGTKPTFGGADRVFEVFVLDYDGDLYDRAIEVRLTRWLRDQWRFAGAAGLIEQMNRDVQRVRAEAGWKVGPGLIVAGR